MTITFGNKVLVNKRAFDKGTYSLYLFILIFAPPVIPYPHLFLTIFSFLSLVSVYKNTAWSILKKSEIYNWTLAMTFLAIYTVCVPLLVSMLCNDIVNLSHYSSVINRYGVLVVAVSVCVTYILCKASRNGYSYKFLLESLINAGLIEGVCSIVAFLFPAVKKFFIYFMGKFAGSYLYSNTWYITVRSYGFASTLVDVFGLGIGIIAGISFFYGLNEKKKYIFKSIVIAIAALLNSRTGLLIYLIAIAISILFVIKEGKTKKLLSTIIALVIFVIFASQILNILSTNEATASWFQSGIDSIERLLSGEKLENGSNDPVSLLFQQSFWQLPNFPRIIIGTGHSLYLAQGYHHSDVGYINEIWLFGILGCILLYGAIIKICINLIKDTKSLLFQFTAVFILAAYFFFNIKGAALGYNPGAVSMFVVLFVETYYKNQKGKVVT